MSDQANQENRNQSKAGARREMSRRQFLSYTLGGAGAFMAANTVIPMVRFAVDPILQTSGESGWVKVVAESDIKAEPQSFTFKVHQVDGWYESDVELSAWIAKENGSIFALSPICKHLGCTINWNSEHNNEYVCPCHGAHYTKEGKNLVVAPAPLDQYDVKIENGFVYLGALRPNSIVKA
jgi:menaquinol-cytochrome c reductase iron-sulfur subunit